MIEGSGNKTLNKTRAKIEGKQTSAGLDHNHRARVRQNDGGKHKVRTGITSVSRLVGTATNALPAEGRKKVPNAARMPLGSVIHCDRQRASKHMQWETERDYVAPTNPKRLELRKIPKQEKVAGC